MHGVSLTLRNLSGKLAIAALIICGLASLALWASVPGLGPLRGLSLLDYLPRYFALFALYLAAFLIFSRTLPHPHTPKLIFLFALLFRLPLLTTPPTLSDDVYRYLWDGNVQNAGVNPYAHRVDSPALDGLATPTRALVNNPQMASPYLPAAQIVFAVVYRLFPELVTAFQVVAMLFDLATGLLIMALLRRLGRQPAWAIVYLWNPLIVAEFAHGAHIDALMVMLMMGGLLAMTNERYFVLRITYSVLSPLLLGLATLVKPIPILLLPILLPRWGWKRTAIYGLTVFVGLAVYSGAGWGLTTPLDAGTGLFGATRLYLSRWNFNGGLYHWLEVFVTGYKTEGAVPTGTPGIETAKMICAGLLLVILVVVFWRSKQLPTTEAAKLWIAPIFAYLLLTPTVHPWYLAPLIALLPFSLFPCFPVSLSSLYLSTSISLSYLTYLDPLNLRETEFVRRWEYWPVYGLLLSGALARALRQRHRGHVAETEQVDDEPGDEAPSPL
jgi:hypothetical protein